MVTMAAEMEVEQDAQVQPMVMSWSAPLTVEADGIAGEVDAAPGGRRRTARRRTRNRQCGGEDAVALPEARVG